jgi:hypothetical protein
MLRSRTRWDSLPLHGRLSSVFGVRSACYYVSHPWNEPPFVLVGIRQELNNLKYQDATISGADLKSNILIIRT